MNIFIFKVSRDDDHQTAKLTPPIKNPTNRSIQNRNYKKELKRISTPSMANQYERRRHPSTTISREHDAYPHQPTH